MPLYINDPEVDRVIKDLTTRLKIGKTEAVRRALTSMANEAKAASRPSFWEAIDLVQEEARRHGFTAESPDRGAEKLANDANGGK